MNFQSIPPVESPQGYLDIAFVQAKKGVAVFKRKLRKGAVLEQAVKAEQRRLQEIAKSLQKSLGRLSKTFPNLEALSEFDLQLLRTALDQDQLRGALASVATASKNIQRLARSLGKGYAVAETKEALLKRKRTAIGRLSSLVNHLARELSYLQQARAVLRTFPDIREGAFVVAIAGFPNVGKSTLLNALTGSKAEIDSYAFTTKTLNSGSFEHRFHTIQCIDTPGTLARDHLNPIEEQALLAMKYAAHLIVYVYDLTEPYPLADQQRLEAEIRMYDKPVIRYVSKRDLLGERVERFAREQGAFTAVKDVKAAIRKVFEEEFL